MKRNHLFAFLLSVIALSACLTGCMGNDEGTGNAAQEDYMPSATPDRYAQDAGTPEAMYDWAGSVGEIERNIMALSEVGEARVAVAGNVAIVGVVFADGYAGEMTERIHDMIASEVLSVDEAIKTVAVTADSEAVTEIAGLSDRMKAGESQDALKSDVIRIANEPDLMK